MVATLEDNETLNAMIDDLIKEHDLKEATLWESIGWIVEDTTNKLTLNLQYI